MLFQNWLFIPSIKRKLQFSYFYLKDLLSGGIIRSNLLKIRSIQSNSMDASAQEFTTEKLNSLLEYANKNVPFYRELGKANLHDLPVVNKGIINDAYDQFRSDEFLNSQLHEVYTSGSTGVPFKLLQDEHKRMWHTASLLYFMEQSNYQLGNLLFELEVIRGAEVRSEFENFKRSTIQFDISNLSDQGISEIIESIKKLKGKKNILGFSSGLEAVGEYMESHAINLNHCNLQGIIANSEKLCENTRKTLEERFGCPVFSRYSNEELGILAHETKHSGKRFELNWSSFYYEILEMHEDIPVQDGEMGRIVVTDLHNHAMPILRYDTGDVGQFEIHNGGRRYLKTVEGRKMDVVYNTKGDLIASFVVITLFYPFKKEVKQYQFIQTGAQSYLIKINPRADFQGEKELIELVKKEFGSDAEVAIEYVSDIPALSSGKRKKVVNLFHS